MPSVEILRSEQDLLQPDLANELVARICAAFKLADQAQTPDPARDSPSVWSDEGWCNRQRPLLDALRTGNIDTVRRAMSSFFSSSASYGFALGADEYLAITESEERKRRFIRDWIGRLRLIAICLGDTQLPNPEREEAGAIPHELNDAARLLASVEHVTGVPLHFPSVMESFGCSLCDTASPIPYQALSYYLVAANCVSLLGAGRRRIVEFGSGFGGVALYLSRHGVDHYTSYDLPFACAVQAYFLGSALGPNAIRLFGESPKTASRIDLLPVSALPHAAPPPHDLLLAQDSLVEVPADDAERILRLLLPSNEWCFLSIAPDFTGSTASWDGTRVRDIVKNIGGHRLALRFPFAIRDGHLLEIFLRNR